MTSALHPPATGPLSRLTGTRTLLRLALRRDRVVLPVWAGALTWVLLQTALAFRQLYDSAAERAATVHSANGNGSLRALYGPAYDSSVGGLLSWRMMAFGAVLAALMSMILVVRHTREEEETGRQELLSSGVVARHAPLAAALSTATLANLLFAVLTVAGLVALGQPALGSTVLALALAGVGLVFAGVAACAAQLTQSARLAKGLTGAVLGAAFALRAAGDADSGTVDGSTSPLSWLSPLGWAQQSRPYAGNHPGPLALLLVTALVLALAAHLAVTRRDVGASFLATRPGPAVGRLGGTWALSWRLQRGTLLGWAVGFALAGLLFGSMAEGAAELVGDNQATRDIIARMGGRAGLTDAFLSAMVGVFGMVAAVYAVGAVLRCRSEESEGRAEALLAGALGRLEWAGSHLVYGLLGAPLLLALAGASMGLAYGVSAGDPGAVGEVTVAALAQAPAVWTLTGIAVLVVGRWPRLSGAVWGLVGVVLAIGWLGPAVDLPQPLMDLAPFTHLPKLPGNAVSWPPYGWLTALGLATTVAGLLGLRRRDLDLS
ncbi:ABC transporter permease [Streptomyces sp. NPDC005438]|uniref:ABC transporter permease n=1 Tax=Streptomyces sp. NPDC005438 TaxID=3156880 RepID=UPI0033A83DAC